MGRRSLELSFYLQIQVLVSSHKVLNLVQALLVLTSAPTAMINSVKKPQHKINKVVSKYSFSMFPFWWHKEDSQVHVLQSASRSCDIIKSKGPMASVGISVMSLLTAVFFISYFTLPSIPGGHQ